MLELHEVSKVYDGVAVVDAVSLCVTEGQTTAIIGPSGCGKSTLIWLMNGLIRPDEGRVSFRGQALTPANAPALRQRVALMRALMLDPDVTSLDEPLGALDPMIRYELQAELRDMFVDLGKTVVLVTHDLAEAAYFGDQGRAAPGGAH